MEVMPPKIPLSLKISSRPRRPVVLLALGWYAAAIHRGIARYAGKERWILDICMSRTRQFPHGWKGDGIICNLGLDAQMDRLVEEAKVPIVNIGNLSHPRIPRVTSDNAAVGRMAADYFLQRGFKHFAFYMRENTPGEQERMAAFRDRIQASGHRFYKIDCTATPQPPSNFSRWLAKELSNLPKPIAILAEYDDRAIEVLDACVTGNIPVPEQIAVLGVSNDPLRCDFAPVPLSSIDDDEELIGYEAAALLGQLMKGKAPASKSIYILPKGVVNRQSTDILAVDHPLVASALRMIWEHYTEPINAKHVGAAIPMSSRRLHDAFLHHIGHSMADEITHKRLERAQNLLMETDKKLSEIASLSGFTSEERMSKVFKHVLGVTPGSYRRRFLQESQPPHIVRQSTRSAHPHS
jgi:LacI family transcriptional regulator